MSSDHLPKSEPPQVLSVSQFTSQIKNLLEGSFPEVHVAGEISNFSRPQSGHCYLTLKDETAQLRAVIWRGSAARVKFELQDGVEVICQGHLDLYAPRGSYQLVIQQIVPQGIGALELALRQLRDKLSAEGLFDPKHKKPLPAYPRRVAFVTSPTGAAVRDFLEVISRRWKSLEIMVVPVRVQGDQAAAEIAAGIKAVNQMPTPPDVLIVGRGGGSIEDLWCFNEELVVRAIFASKVPVISAVGHEIDITLSDLVADVRALTPTEAAELVVPHRDEVLRRLRNSQTRLISSMNNRLLSHRTKLEALKKSSVFRRPFSRIAEMVQQLDQWQNDANRAIRQIVMLQQKKLTMLAAQLDSLSPLNVLSRGYSITQSQSQRKTIKNIEQLEIGESVTTILQQGRFISKVESVIPDEAPQQKTTQKKLNF